MFDAFKEEEGEMRKDQKIRRNILHGDIAGFKPKNIYVKSLGLELTFKLWHLIPCNCYSL